MQKIGGRRRTQLQLSVCIIQDNGTRQSNFWISIGFHLLWLSVAFTDLHLWSSLKTHQASQRDAEHRREEEPHDARPLHPVQEGTAQSGLRWLEQAEAL